MALSAICSGVIGTLSDFPVVSPDPVTAQVMKTSLFICNVIDLLPLVKKPVWLPLTALG
jgi:hypothetical protein